MVTERPLARGRRPAGVCSDSEPAWRNADSDGLGLVGDLAVDGEIEADLLLVALDPDAEDEAGDLDDDERGDDRIGDRRDRRRRSGSDLARVAVDEAGTPLIAVVAKTPVAIAPNVPPTPWTANTSSASSILRNERRSVAL